VVLSVVSGSLKDTALDRSRVSGLCALYFFGLMA